ncbi:MAG: 50S ribosomal protein L11 [Candidatus Blackburnbacteria bacterium RIFCSPHIGHO2_12_FULL_44_25]|nr:MAG: 50S ribosomal protein L11 [Candidatus Blackburnbacteria bacterium RIFCSPHIGHO2_12_FULL_44_25]
MAAKKIKTIVKLNLPAGEASPAPPVGTALGQHGIAIMEFVKSYNEKTADQKGNIVPVVLTIYEDRSFDFITKLAPVAELIKKELKIEKGSGIPNKQPVGTMTQDQLRKIAETKLGDLNTKNIDQAMKVVAGTARSMGVKVSS